MSVDKHSAYKNKEREQPNGYYIYEQPNGSYIYGQGGTLMHILRIVLLLLLPAT